MTTTEIQEFDLEIIGRHVMDIYQYRINHPNSSTAEACRELGLNYRTALQWLKDGKLNQYLSSIHDPRSDLSQAKALNHLPDIVDSMAQIAMGTRTIRGMNPQAAAEFVLKVAQMGARPEEKAPRNVFVQNTYVPGRKEKPGPVVEGRVREISNESD